MSEIKYEGSIESFESIFPMYCFDTYLDNKIKFIARNSNTRELFDEKIKIDSLIKLEQVLTKLN